MIKWLLIPENAAFLNWVGFFVGGVGIVLALFGLWLTLKQLKAIKTEAEAQKAAIEAVQFKVASFDTAQECQIARSLIQKIQSHLQSRAWPEVLTAYEKLVESFLRLSHSNSAIHIDDRALLIKLTKNMADICEGIRKRQLVSGQAVILRGQDQAIRDFSDIMTKITFSVARDIQK